MTHRINREDCEARLAQIARQLKIPLLKNYPVYANAPGNALYIETYSPGDRAGVRCKVLTKDGRAPFGSEYCLGYKELYGNLYTAVQLLFVQEQLDAGGYADYHKDCNGLL